MGSPVPAFDPLTLATCPECGHEVKSRGLGTHRRLRHGYAASDSVKAPVRCPDCGKAIAQSQNLTRHRQQVHGGQKRGGNGAAAPVIRKGRETFLCSRCPESFSSRDALDTHLVVAHPDTTTRRLPVGEQPSVLASLGVE